MREGAGRAGAAGCAALAALLGLAGVAAGDAHEAAGQAPARPATSRVSPALVELGGVRVGTGVAQAERTLEANGFQRSQIAQRRWIDETGEVRRRVRFRELPGPDGSLMIYELDETAWYPPTQFDPERYKTETIARLGEPEQVLEPNVGRVELVYSDVAKAPTVIQVIEACQAELRKKDPELSAEEAEKRASEVSQYRAVNDQIEKTCPGATAAYKKMASALEAPRLTVTIRSGRVDTRVSWPWVEAELVRRLGPEKAREVIVFGAKALEQEPSGP